MDKEILTRKEAAKYLNVSLSYFATFQHEIKQIRIGRAVRFDKEDLNKWIESKKE